MNHSKNIISSQRFFLMNKSEGGFSKQTKTPFVCLRQPLRPAKLGEVLYLIILLTISAPSFAQTNNFPSWMDEVSFEKKSSFSDFNGPVDPETGKTSTLEPKRGKGFKPKLPDFAEMRKKATKVETETGSDTLIIKENTSNSTIQNIKDIPELATATNIIEAVKRLASEKATGVSKNIIEDEEPSEEELRKRRTYRPGQIKSFYLESKQKQKEEMKSEN